MTKYYINNFLHDDDDDIHVNYKYVMKFENQEWYMRDFNNPNNTKVDNFLWSKDQMHRFILSGTWVEITKEKANYYCKKWYKKLNKQ